MYRLFGSIDLLGNPASLIENMVIIYLIYILNKLNFYYEFICIKLIKCVIYIKGNWNKRYVMETFTRVREKWKVQSIWKSISNRYLQFFQEIHFRRL